MVTDPGATQFARAAALSWQPHHVGVWTSRRADLLQLSGLIVDPSLTPQLIPPVSRALCMDDPLHATLDYG